MMLTDLQRTHPPFVLPDGWSYHVGVRNGITIYCMYNTIDDLFMEFTAPITAAQWTTTTQTLTKSKVKKG